MDHVQPWAEAVAISSSRIIAVGTDQQILTLMRKDTPAMNLEGRLVLPGLCDGHIHLYDWCLSRRQVALSGCRSRDEMLQRISQWTATQSPETWVIGRGWNESAWDDPTLPTRAEIDQVTGPLRPALFWRSDMHAAVANSAALKLAAISASTKDPIGGLIGRDERGHPNGLLWELAINLVTAHMPHLGPSDLDGALSAGIAELHRLGITAVHDQRMKDQSEGPIALNAYQRLNAKGQITVRIHCNIAAHDLNHVAALGLRAGFGDDRLRLGHIKLFADGTMGSRTAWLLEPYEKDNPSEPKRYGMNVTPVKQLATEINRAIELGFPVSVHAIGDRANRAVLDIFEELVESTSNPALPHRIEHVQIIDPVDLPRLAQLGLTASVQPIHILDDMQAADRLLGSRTARLYRLRSLAREGTLLALGSDAPVADPNPFLGMQAAIYRQSPQNPATGPWHGDERLDLAQVLYGYTMGAASAAGWQETIGSITPGKRADMIVLDRDIIALVNNSISRSELADTQVLLTIFDGQVVYRNDNDW